MREKRKQIGALFLTVCLIFSCLPLINATAATEDTTPPEIKEVYLSATSVQAPGEIEIVVDATDDVSGIDYGYIYFTNVETGKRLGAYLSVTNIPSTHTSLYEEGKLYGVLEFNQYVSGGTYKISSISINDKADNWIGYIENEIPENIKDLSIEVINGSMREDTTPPEIKEVYLSATSVKVPGEIEIVVDATDDVSGIDYGYIYFTNVETGKRLGAYLSVTNIPSTHTSLYEEGKLYGVLEFNQYVSGGTYKISSISINDKADNWIGYIENEIPENIKNLSIEVINGSMREDTTPPEIKEVYLSATSVKAPGEIEIVVDATDDVSGIDYGYIYFTNVETGKRLGAYLSVTNIPNTHTSLYEEGKLYGFLEFNQYVSGGTYKISSISINDKADNWIGYIGNELPENLKELSIEVINDGKAADIVTGINNPNLVQDISSASNSAIIAVDYTSNSVIQKDIFDAIKGTEKTLIMESEGVQWVFEGANITKDTKNIDLQVSTKKITEDTAGGAIEGHTQDANAVVVTFAKNGELPGKSKIRIKADYVLKQYLGQNGLYVYYYDNTNDKFELIAQNITVTRDSYIEFEIEHCSKYVIANGECSIESPVATPKPTAIPSPTPGTPNGGSTGGNSGGGGTTGGGNGGAGFPVGGDTGKGNEKDSTAQTDFRDEISKSEVKISIDKSKESAAVLIHQTGTTDGSKTKAKLSADILKRISDVIGTKNCGITLNITDDKGATVYSVELSKEDLIAGKTLTAYVYQNKSDSYVILKTNTCEVAQDGSLEIFFDKLESGNSYRILNKADAEKTTQAIMRTVFLKKTTQNVKVGEAVKVTFYSKLNMSNIAEVTYSTSNKKVATVSKAGNIKALQKGTAKIMVKVVMNDGTKKNLPMTIRVK